MHKAIRMNRLRTESVVRLALGMLLVVAAGITGSGQGIPEYSAHFAATPPRIDGDLSDPAWSGAAPALTLTQQDPGAGQPASERTEVQVLFDHAHIYIAVRCLDSEPKKITAGTMVRDAELFSDDYVRILLDTFQDRRTGYVFSMNPAGARTDGLAKGEEVDTSWDGIWDGRARRVPDGWTLEIRIPTKTIAFKPDLNAWGFNVERNIKRKIEVDRWTGCSLNAHFANPAEAGLLTGLESLKQGRGYSVRPYASFKSSQDFAANLPRDNTFDAGFDVYKSLASNLNGVFTYNTDFAETEVDSRQINLTRFSLFFPEKRGFFLEGSQVFDFGPSLGNVFRPFFSRRIGLLENEQVPILAGVKLWGQVGNTSLGLLDVETDRVEGFVDRQNLLAARVRQNIWDQSYIGAILTRGDPAGLSDNTLAGLDFLYSTNRLFGDRNFSAGAWYTYSRSDRAAGRPDAWGISVDYPNDLLDTALRFQSLGDGVDPALGFLPRQGVNHLTYSGALMPRPQRWGVRQVYFEWGADVYWFQEGGLESRELFLTPLAVLFNTGEHFETNYESLYEYLREPFEIADGVVIPPGAYSFDRYGLEFDTAYRRWWILEGGITGGTFYDGRMDEYWGQVTIKPSAKFRTSLNVEHVNGRLPAGKFIQRLARFRVTYSWSPDLELSAFTQYDNESENLGTNIRFRWTLKPGNDLFVVYNRGWNRMPGESLSLAPAFDQIALKFVYTWRP